MENAGTVVFGFYILILDGALAATLVVAAVIFRKKGKTQGKSLYGVLGLVCLVIGGICAIPFVFVFGYLLYFYVRVRLT